MVTRRRALEPLIRPVLPRKMVFIGGPRQVGKTTLALALVGKGADETHLAYFNWDDPRAAARLRRLELPPGQPLLVLDEIHKYARWRNLVKGLYDTEKSRRRIVVTGSARLDYYRKGGDSLAGRYRYFRLHPFSLGEVVRKGRPATIEPGLELPLPRASAETADALRLLLAYGGFPEPFLSQSSRTHRRWQKERMDRVFREDVRDLEAVRDLSSIEWLADMLPDRVGSPLSLNAIREDLEVSHRALMHWMDVLEHLYYVVRIKPFVSRNVRSLRKMPKAYVWDWSQVAAPGPRFENLVAMHLLKLCHFLQDHDGHAVDLRYLRDRTGREVDFLVTLEGKPWLAVEAKLSETTVDPALVYFRDRLRIPHVYQVVLNASRAFVERGIRVLPAHVFLAGLQ